MCRHRIFGAMAGAPRETKVWQEAIGLAGDVIRVVRRATRRETKAFTDALMLSAAAVASAVAEAPTRPVPRTSASATCARAVRWSTVETQLAIARVSGIIPSSVHAQLASRVASLSQRVTNHMNHDRSRGRHVAGRVASLAGRRNLTRSRRRLVCRFRFALPDSGSPQPRLRKRPWENRSTRSTARSRDSDAGRVPTTRCAVLERCDEEAKPRIRATSAMS